MYFRKSKKKIIDQLRSIGIRSRIKDDDATGSRETRGSRQTIGLVNRFRR